ncbi:MAG: L-lactate permease [Leptolyngbyaceae cyanobacterium SM2_3_12]|nr:L-lactate permease [Leptolyngbyaceae cyanobacterium SM2_3_12]
MVSRALKTLPLAIYSLLAFMPIVTAFLLLVVANRPAAQAMAAAYGVTVVLAWLIWQVPLVQVAASTVEGLVVTLEILYIVFGAILLLNVLQESGAIGKIRQGLLGISSDRRVQLIIIAWLFGSFIEGASGFGTPAVICVPLLVTIGFPAMAAVIAMLMIQSTASAFGGVGVPIVIGLQSGLEGNPAVDQEVANLGLTFSDYLGEVTLKTGLIQGLIGIFMPLLIVMAITTYFGQARSWRDGLPAARFALFAGLAFALPYTLTAIFIGPEFPTLLGGLVGLALVIPAAKRGFLAPHSPWDFPDRHKWPSSWLGANSGPAPAESSPMTAVQAWTPYVLLSLFLILSRIKFLPFRGWLQSAQIDVFNIFGTPVSISTQPLFLPGTIFILVVLVTYFLYRMSLGQLRRATWGAMQKLAATALAIGASVPMAKVFINSGVNNSGLASMPLTLADGVANLAGSAWSFFAPFVAMTGSFVAGSTTVSNMMFGLFQFGVAQEIGATPSLILALQVVGAAAGNMIAVSNIVTAVSTVGLVGREGLVLRKLLPVVGIYLLVAGIIGLLAAWKI